MHVENTTLEPSKASLRVEVARWISAIVHPVAFPLVTLGIACYLATGSLPKSVQWVLLAMALVSLPVSILVATQVLSRRWTDLDVSVRQQRYALYPFGLVCMLALALVFAHFGAPEIAVRAAVAIVIANLADGIINFAYKVSAHSTGAAICAAILWAAAPAWGVVGAIAALAVGWSRVELKRHTPGQVLLGWAVGLLTALIAFHLPFLARA